MKRLLAACALLLAGAGQAGADELLRLPGPSSTLINVKVKTLVDLRFTNIVRQTLDVSCGAAALATLMTHFLNRPMGEEELIEAILANAADDETKKNIAKFGFSMLELKRASDRLGFQTGGFRIDDVSKLVQLKVPALTLINVGGYNHFVVIKGVIGDRIFLADPAFGNRSRSLDAFASEWSHVILVVIDPSQSGGNKFALEGTTKAPIGRAISAMDIVLRGFTPPARQQGEF
jgi:predicted double-glycine peptidase